MNLGAQHGEQPRHIAGRAADQQHLLPRLDIGGDEHPSGDERRVEHPVAAERDRTVDIGDARQLRGHMRLARDGPHRCDDGGIDDIAGAKLAVDHRRPHRRRAQFAVFGCHQPVSDSAVSFVSAGSF